VLPIALTVQPDTWYPFL